MDDFKEEKNKDKKSDDSSSDEGTFSGFMSLEDSQEISQEHLISGPPKPKKKKPEKKKSDKKPPIAQETKKKSADFSYDLDFSPEHTRQLRRQAIEKRKIKKKPEPPPSEMMSAPLVTESPHGKPDESKKPAARRDFEDFEDSEILGKMPEPPSGSSPDEGPAIALERPPKPSVPGIPTPVKTTPRGKTAPVPVTAGFTRPALIPPDEKTSWYMYALLLLFLCLVGIFSYRHVCNFDIWWHLKTGSDILESRSLPGNDLYSYTASGRSVFTPYPMAQVLFALLDRAGGVNALIIFKTALVLLAFLFCVLAAPGKRRVGIIALWLALAAMFASNERLLVRPHLISLVMAPLFFLILERHERRSTRWIWVLPLAAIIWANWHPSWIFGVLLVLASLAGHAVFYFYGINLDEKKLEKRRIAILAVILILVVIAGFATPNHVNGFLHPFRQMTTLSDVNEGVGEWTSPLKGFTLLSTNLIYWKILAAAGILSFLVNWKHQRLSHLLIFAGVLILSLTAYRHMALFALLAAPIAAGNFHAFLDRQRLEAPGRFTATILGLIFAGVLAYLATGFLTNDYYRSRKLYAFESGSGISHASIPVSAVEKFHEMGIKGNGFHNYHLGGYIMYRLGPETKVFLDGRLLHYPQSVRDDYRAVKSDTTKWNEISIKPEYSFEWAMLSHTTGEFRALIKYLWKNPQWTPVYVDSSVMLFVKKTGLNSALAEKINPESLGYLENHDYGSEAYESFHWRQLGRLFTDLGQFRWAENFLQKAKEKSYGFPDVEIDMGTLALLSGNVDAAKRIFEIARPRAKYEASIGLGLAELADTPPGLERAQSHFERALEFNPGSVEAYVGLARIWIAKNRPIEAERNLEKALEIDPYSSEAIKLQKKIRSK